MVDGPKNIETSKQLSALRQIEAAIVHFHNAEFECAMTLAAAAEGLLPTTDKPHIFAMLRKKAADLDLNLFINWLKHPTGPDKGTISEFEVVITIFRAISKFIAVYGKTSRNMNDFLKWGVAAGHLPKGI